MNNKKVRLKLGTVLDGSGRPFEFSLGDLVTPHFAVAGMSGTGKSRLIKDLTCQLVEQHVGCTVVDPGGDLVEDILAHLGRSVIQRKSKRILNRVHLLDPGNYSVVFGMDPLRFDPAKPIHDPEIRENAYRAWLHTAVQYLGELVQLKQGQTDFEQNARLQRVLTNLLTATGMAVDDEGNHLPLADALILLDLDHNQNPHVFQKVAPHLDRDTLTDFRRLRSYKRVEDRIRESESTINRLRSLLSPIARAILSATGQDDVLNVRKAILRGETMLWRLRPSEYLSHDGKSTFGKLAIHTTLSTMLSMPRDMRVPHVLIIDEASEFANEQLMWALGAMRKTGTPFSIVLVGQDLSSFRRGEFDMAPKLVSQMNLIVFNQSWPADTEIFARVLHAGEYSFTPLEIEQQLHAGYRRHHTTSTSTQVSVQRMEGEDESQQESVGLSHQVGKQKSRTSSRQKTRSKQSSVGSADSASNSESVGKGQSKTQQPIMNGIEVRNRVDVPSASSQESQGSQQGHSDTRSDTTGESESEGESMTEGESETVGTTKTVGRGKSKKRAASVGVSEGESHQEALLAEIETRKVKSGKLEIAFNDQIEKRRDAIASQEKRHAIVKLQGVKGSFPIYTREVPDPFRSPKAHMKMVDWVANELRAIHPYLKPLDLSPAAEEARVRDYLEAGQRADEPVETAESDREYFAEEYVDTEEAVSEVQENDPFTGAKN